MMKAILICAAVAVLCGCQPAEKSYFGVYGEVSVSEIRAEGWFRGLLETQRDGLGLHRSESGYPYNTCLWAGTIPKGGNPIAQAWWPYEQSGYIVDGLYRCGILLGDTTLTDLGRRNAAYVLEHSRPNGMLGPEALGSAQWAFSVFARVLLADYDLTGDPMVLDRLKAHFSALPDSLTNRQTCIIESMCKVYSHTGESEILNRAEQIWRTFSIPGTADNEAFRHADMVAEAPVEVHGVTAAEVSKQPAILYLYTGNKEYLEAAEGFYASVERDHELADGIPTSCEKLLGKAPEALHEICDISDFMWSYGYMLMATGDVKWADKMENAFYNAALGAVSKDFRSHQYFSSPNQILATQFSSAADYGDEGLPRQAYRPGFDTECCSGNVHRMFPNYASRMWLRDGRGGIVAALYAPGRISTQVGDRPVTVTANTDYPFRGTVEFKFECPKAVKMPFTMRIPAWAEGATVRVNDESSAGVAAGTFFTVERKFREGDRITLDLPMRPRMEPAGDNGVNIRRGPLLFSVNIAENVEKITGQMKTSDSFPAWDITPASPWNYALASDAQIDVVEHPIGDTPWLAADAPVRLRLKAYEIPSWKAKKTTPTLPTPGFTTASAPTWIELIPSGSTRIRLTTFPIKK